MKDSLFVSDLHGHPERYRKLFGAISKLRPPAVFLGGDLLPHPLLPACAGGNPDFIEGFLAPGLARLRGEMSGAYPRVFLILGNDDPRAVEEAILDGAEGGLWEYAHGRRIAWEAFTVYGYTCVPPTPFHLKDWERYDVSRYVDPGCYAPEEGWRSVGDGESERVGRTIRDDLEMLAGDDDVNRAVFLMHAPPYKTALDRAALDGKSIEHAPVDVHVGSIAVRRFIEARQPLLTLHGHVHESARLTLRWKEQIGRTWAFSAAHDGPELALVCFDPEDPSKAVRHLL